MFAAQQSRANAYARVHVETGVPAADPHQLVAMLYDGALAAIATACSAVERKDVAAKGKAISRAVLIIEEGLRGALDREAGGDVAASLDSLYLCLLYRLTLANARNDRGLLLECSALLSPLRDAWKAIRAEALSA